LVTVDGDGPIGVTASLDAKTASEVDADKRDRFVSRPTRVAAG
jgi:hypothetical protein